VRAWHAHPNVQQRWQRRVDAWSDRLAENPFKRAWRAIAVATVTIAVAGGLLVRVTDPGTITSIGTGLWWSLQTVTTVGYGDVVPSSGTGRVIGAIVMISGIAFLTVITAAVTAALIEAARRRQPPATDREQLPDLMREMTARLSAIETRLDELRPPADE